MDKKKRRGNPNITIKEGCLIRTMMQSSLCALSKCVLQTICLKSGVNTTTMPICLSLLVTIPLISLSTSTGLYRHVWVDLQYNVFALIQKQYSKRFHLLRDTAWLWDPWNYTNRLDYALDGCVVGGSDHLK